MEKHNFDPIFKYIRTTDERSEFIDLVEELIENNFKRDQDPLPNTPFSKNAIDAIYAEINRIGIGRNREEIEKILEKLLNEVKELPEMRITIAIAPTENLKNNLKAWAIENNIPNVIFNIEINSEIVAGAIIMSPEGEYGNYALSNQLDNYFVTKKQEVLALL